MVIRSGKSKISLVANSNILDKIQKLDFIYNYIPEVSIDDTNNQTEYKLIILDNEKDVKLEINNYSFSFSYNAGHNITGEDLVTVIDYCFDYIRQEMGVYCVHGSAAEKNGKGVLFFGPISGIGKTTVTLNLCLKKNFSFIGDDKILINSYGEIEGGAKLLRYNKSALNQSVSENLDKLSPEEIKAKVKISKSNSKITLIVLPILSHKTAGLEIEKWDSIKSNFHIYEELTRKIRGTSRRVGNYNYPLESLDSRKLAQKRSIFSSILSERVPFYMLKGNPDEVLDKVTELID